MKKPQNGSLSRYLADPVRTVMNLRPGGYATLALGAACVLLFFELVMRSFSEQAGSGIIAVCSALCLAALLFGVLRRGEKKPLMVILAASALMMLALAAHLSLLNVRPGRMTRVLDPLLDELWSYDLPVAMAWEKGAWSGGYLILMALIAHMEDFFALAMLSALHAVKLIDLAALTAAALACGRLAEKRGAGYVGYCGAVTSALLLPTMLMNGGLWAQCDAIFAAFALWGMVELLEERPLAGCLLLGASLAFKLQAIFVFPLLPVFFMKRKLGIRHLAALALAFMVFHLPMLIDGQDLMSILGRYNEQILITAYGDDTDEQEEQTEEQTEEEPEAPPEQGAAAEDAQPEQQAMELPTHEGLADHAASVYSLMTVASVREFSGMGMYLGIACALLVATAMLRSRRTLTEDTVLTACMLLCCGLPLILPQANARFLYLAGLVSLTRLDRPVRMLEAAVLELISLCCYMEAIFSTEAVKATVIPMNVLSLAAIAVACMAAWELYTALAAGEERDGQS